MNASDVAEIQIFVASALDFRSKVAFLNYSIDKHKTNHSFYSWIRGIEAL